ncbi:MAG: response regulator transcription factor [Calditrichia bacterium]
MTEFLAASLEQTFQNEGFQTTVVFDGSKGWELADVERFDLLILDIGLPKMDGLAVSGNYGRKISIRRLFCFYRSRTAGRQNYRLDVGAAIIWQSCLPQRSCLARARALLRRKSAFKSTQINIGDLTVNTSILYEVFCRQQLVNLTPTEYRMLTFLLHNANRVVTRLAITEHVWDDNFDLMTNVVDVHIRNLRKKLDECGMPNLIATVRGIGYTIKTTGL